MEIAKHTYTSHGVEGHVYRLGSIYPNFRLTVHGPDGQYKARWFKGLTAKGAIQAMSKMISDMININKDTD